MGRILSFNVIKLNRITPKISERLLSYVTNSLSRDSNILALGIATELLITARGMAFDNPVL